MTCTLRGSQHVQRGEGNTSVLNAFRPLTEASAGARGQSRRRGCFAQGGAGPAASHTVGAPQIDPDRPTIIYVGA